MGEPMPNLPGPPPCARPLDLSVRKDVCVAGRGCRVRRRTSDTVMWRPSLDARHVREDKAILNLPVTNGQAMLTLDGAPRIYYA